MEPPIRDNCLIDLFFNSTFEVAQVKQRTVSSKRSTLKGWGILITTLVSGFENKTLLSLISIENSFGISNFLIMETIFNKHIAKLLPQYLIISLLYLTKYQKGLKINIPICVENFQTSFLE